jgi:NAD(P)-dependent dehydrogenase (short-subunit alcohol dehydrogenase family)
MKAAPRGTASPSGRKEGQLAGQRAVVTGASRGIGRAIALRFAEAGAALALCARDPARLAATLAEVSTRGRAFAEPCHVGRADEVQRFAARIERELGVPDVIVHNAGVVERARLEELSEDAWDRVLDVNLKGPFLLTRALLPAMRARRRGRIVFIGSISGTLGTPRLSAYCASKHAVIGLCRALAEEVRDDGLQVNVINPGSVDTDMLRGSGFAPQMSPEQIAEVALYLAADAPTAMTGASLDVFG